MKVSFFIPLDTVDISVHAAPAPQGVGIVFVNATDISA